MSSCGTENPPDYEEDEEVPEDEEPLLQLKRSRNDYIESELREALVLLFLPVYLQEVLTGKFVQGLMITVVLTRLPRYGAFRFCLFKRLFFLFHFQ